MQIFRAASVDVIKFANPNICFSSESMMSSKKRRDEVRYATWTMVSITTTYLCCASLSLFISVMENVFPQNSLLFNEDGSR